MITEEALREAIAEVQGKRDPNRQDCIMLAAFYIIQDRLYSPERTDMLSGYSRSGPPETVETQVFSEHDDVVGDYGDSEFLQAISGKDVVQCWKVVDDLMSTLWAINPRLYAGVLREIQAL